MPDIAQIQANLADAEEAKEKLLKERRKNREKMSKSAFRAYNEETRQKQIDVETDIRNARAALTEALNLSRQELLVGTVSETGDLGGANG